MNPLGHELASYLMIIGVALVAHEPWRWLGAYFGHSLSPQDEVFRWVKAVSTALVAGLVMRLVLFPAGVLETTPLAIRVAALATGTVVFYLARRNMLAGILAGCAIIAIGGSVML